MNSVAETRSAPPRERPILFSGPMVKAILAGRKTVTRRIVKPQPEPNAYGTYSWPSHACRSMVETRDMGCLGPYGSKGERLWVRETWHPCDGGPIYAADHDGDKGRAGVERWIPSIYMRRDDSRLLLEIDHVRVERLHAITEEEAEREGVTPFPKDPEGDCWTDGKHRTAFEYLWNEINGWNPNAWQSNPWVWVVAFHVVRNGRGT